MARPKKNSKPITGVSKDPESKLTVQKSLPLFSLWRSDMSLPEFKILDTYLSRINSHKPENRTVLFTKGELEQLLSVKKINKADLSSRLNSLGRFVEIEGSDKKIHKVALFEEAEGDMDENGLWTIRLTCTAKAMKYIFNVEKLGYLRYKLRCITSLTSRYTYVLFMYLEANRFRKSWEVDVDELREILNCNSEPTYAAFKRFNDLILKKCQKELLEKTECRFTYDPIKSGRRVARVRFTLETLAKEIEPPAPEQLSFDDDSDFFADALPDGLTQQQVETLRLVAIPKVLWNPALGPHDTAIYDYLRKKVMQMRSSTKEIGSPFHYLKALIEKDPDIYK